MVKILGDAAYVRLSRRASHEKWLHTLVDLDDFERVSASKWGAARSGKSLYATATSLARLPKHHARLHHFILRTTPGQIVDHINGDTLDNRKQNLRICTAAENAKNARRQTFVGKTSRFKGVCWSKYDGKWLARITSDGATKDLGLFDIEIDAALAYDAAAERLHGDFARINAVMKLFDGRDPFVPDCSGAVEYDSKNVGLNHLRSKRALSPRNYQQRLDDRLRSEIAEYGSKSA